MNGSLGDNSAREIGGPFFTVADCETRGDV